MASKLSYKVGSFETDIYSVALAESKRTKKQITRVYTPIEEEKHIDKEFFKRRIAKIVGER